MVELADIVSPIDLGIELAKNSGRYVMYLRADGPNNCPDPDKALAVWDFYSSKTNINLLVLDALRQDGEVYVYFDGRDYSHECLQEWVVPKKLLEDGEYDLDMDYYIFAEITGPNGEGMGFN